MLVSKYATNRRNEQATSSSCSSGVFCTRGSSSGLISSREPSLTPASTIKQAMSRVTFPNVDRNDCNMSHTMRRTKTVVNICGSNRSDKNSATQCVSRVSIRSIRMRISKVFYRTTQRREQSCSGERYMAAAVAGRTVNDWWAEKPPAVEHELFHWQVFRLHRRGSDCYVYGCVSCQSLVRHWQVVIHAWDLTGRKRFQEEKLLVDRIEVKLPVVLCRKIITRCGSLATAVGRK